MPNIRVPHRCREHGGIAPPPLEEGSSKFDGGLESVHEGNMGVSHGVKSLKNTCKELIC